METKTTKFVIDTNAGPIVTVDQPSVAATKRFMERSIPLLERRGYTSRWRRSNGWHVIDCLNSKGRVVHSAAFRPEPKGQETCVS